MGLDAVELVMAIEEEFQIAISDSEAAECPTVQELVEVILSRVRQTGKPHVLPSNASTSSGKSWPIHLASKGER